MAADTADAVRLLRRRIRGVLQVYIRDAIAAVDQRAWIGRVRQAAGPILAEELAFKAAAQQLRVLVQIVGDTGDMEALGIGILEYQVLDGAVDIENHRVAVMLIACHGAAVERAGDGVAIAVKRAVQLVDHRQTGHVGKLVLLDSAGLIQQRRQQVFVDGDICRQDGVGRCVALLCGQGAVQQGNIPLQLLKI